jgi:hypothetical protein
MRGDDCAALAAKGTIEMYCRTHSCSYDCIFYDHEKDCCALSHAVHYWPALSEEE